MTSKIKVPNPKKLIDALSTQAELLIKNDVNIKYDAGTSKEYSTAANKIISAFDWKVANIHRLVKFRSSYELLIDRKYKTCLSNLEISAQQQLNSCNVPAKTQVILGLLDLMIFRIAHRAKLIRIIYA